MVVLSSSPCVFNQKITNGNIYTTNPVFNQKITNRNLYTTPASVSQSELRGVVVGQ